MWVEIILGVVLILVYLFWRDNYSSKVSRLPPGPLRYPIVGNLPQIMATGCAAPFVAFDKLSKKYGPVMTVKMGTNDPAIVISSYEDLAALCAREECLGRFLYQHLLPRNFQDDYLGIVFNNGECWKQVRRFTIRSLRDFGFGKKKTMDTAINEELSYFVEKVKNDVETSSGGILKCRLFFNLTILNTLWYMLTGKRFSYDDERLLKLLDLNEKGFKSGNFGNDLALAFPFLDWACPWITNKKIFKELFDALHDFGWETIAEHRSRGAYLTDPECFVDVFLAKIDELKEKGDPSSAFFTDKQLNMVLMDLFQTGSETLAGTLSFGLLYMILYPDVQKKVQEEIDEVAGNGEVLFEHKDKLPYTQATILEILRLADIVPIIPPRDVIQDFTYKGYEFKKGTKLLPNLYSVFYSSQYFDDPEKFDPTRYLDKDSSDGTWKLKNPENFAPFGFGKRFCMGETQAIPANFLYFTTLLKHFTFSRVPGQPLPTTEPHLGFTLSPTPFDMVVKVRE